jgi:sugar O-acyltransferase (sialic acid O-acetyltransferase NeuD family)
MTTASSERIVIVGASCHGVVALDAARLRGYDVVGFLDSFKPQGSEVSGVPILGQPDELIELMRQHRVSKGFLGISDNWTRGLVCNQILAICPAFEFVSIIHPSAVIAATATIEPGTLVLAGVIVNPGCSVGPHCIVNTRASLDHDTDMAPFSSLLPGAITAGNVSIGEYSCVCMGAMIRHKIRIGEHSLVGAGAVVLRDIPPFKVAYGVPARIIRDRVKGERHM